MFQAEGATLQHLKTKALTLVSVDVHGHDCQRKLSRVLHLKTLSNGEQRLVGAEACEGQSASVSLRFLLFA